METKSVCSAASADRLRHPDTHSQNLYSQAPQGLKIDTGQLRLVSAPSVFAQDERERRRIRRAQAAQRALDVLLALALLALLLPVFLLIALLISAETRGPVLFVQTRVGRDGRKFRFFKFRSMYQDAEARRAALEARNERTGPVFKLRHDPRVTRVGRFLRRSSLDELPQLLNVLRGEMSLVGPRPALPHEVGRYTEEERQRLQVTPGLTGLWQVSGRANLSFEESIRLDLHYIHCQSLRLYFGILLRTIPAVLLGRGAY